MNIKYFNNAQVTVAWGLVLSALIIFLLNQNNLFLLIIAVILASIGMGMGICKILEEEKK